VIRVLSPLKRLRRKGTRFLIYPQPKFLRGFSQPEVVYVEGAPGTIGSGPEDSSVYVVDAENKDPYINTGETPPYQGPRYPPVEPGPNGHFDHVEPGTRAFSSTTVFATVKSVLAIWERYFGRKLPWYFHRKYSRLEVIPRMNEYKSAWSRPGYLECGFGDLGPLCENFDVVAHETGHTIIRGTIGFPAGRRSLKYRAHEEAAADLIAIVSSLHFDSVVDHVLEHTKGDLFSVNELSRFGELSKNQQFRKAFNYETMKSVKAREVEDDDDDVYKYRLALPFLGGAFDVLVEIYKRRLVRVSAISDDLAERSAHASGAALARVRREFSGRFQRNEKKFRRTLLEARDYFGKLMARAWDKTSMEGLSYKKVAENMMEADMELSGGQYLDRISESFSWRGILQA